MADIPDKCPKCGAKRFGAASTFDCGSWWVSLRGQIHQSDICERNQYKRECERLRSEVAELKARAERAEAACAGLVGVWGTYNHIPYQMATDEYERLASDSLSHNKEVVYQLDAQTLSDVTDLPWPGEGLLDRLAALTELAVAVTLNDLAQIEHALDSPLVKQAIAEYRKDKP